MSSCNVAQFLSGTLNEFLATGKEMGELEVLFTTYHVVETDQMVFDSSKPNLAITVNSGGTWAYKVAEFKSPSSSKLVFVYAGVSEILTAALYAENMRRIYDCTIVIITCDCEYAKKLDIFQRSGFGLVIKDKCGGAIGMDQIFEAIVRRW